MLNLTAHIMPVLLLVFALLVTLQCAYLLLLTSLSWPKGRPRESVNRYFFDIIVPAHNEAAGIERTVKSLLSIAWPTEQFRVVVIADNCTDNTAAVARAAGATALERRDDSQRGKGYALAYGFEWSRATGQALAVVVVDADSEVTPNLLYAFANRLERGAHAMQAYYGVLNPHASWRTRLMAIALGAFHKLRSRARERLGLSCGIRGNGWCVSHALLLAVPYHAFSLVEDVEFGVDLALADYRVAYCDEAQVRGEMVTNEQSARSQRVRWEGGRLKLIRSAVPLLWRHFLRNQSLICLDLILDLLVSPLANIALAATLLVIAAAAFSASFVGQLALILGLADLFALVLYVARGWYLSEVGARGLLDLVRAPAFMAWKLLLLIKQRTTSTWVRTDREGH